MATDEEILKKVGLHWSQGSVRGSMVREAMKLAREDEHDVDLVIENKKLRDALKDLVNSDCLSHHDGMAYDGGIHLPDYCAKCRAKKALEGDDV